MPAEKNHGGNEKRVSGDLFAWKKFFSWPIKTFDILFLDGYNNGVLMKYNDICRDGRVVDCGGLENRWNESFRGFESLSLRQIIDKFRQGTCRFLFKPKGLACNHGLPCMELPSGVCHFGLMPCNSTELIAYSFADYIHATAWLKREFNSPLKIR